MLPLTQTRTVAFPLADGPALRTTPHQILNGYRQEQRLTLTHTRSYSYILVAIRFLKDMTIQDWVIINQ